ncbi:MAG: hypothetical protein K2Y08_03475 [Alphaproteobacteria bacterium]|nr:hypothetical protein [Alphaproteobacteria bacterium]
MFKSIVLVTTLSFFTVSSAEAVKDNNIFNTDDWFNDFKNIFKKPADPMNPPGNSHKIIKEAILLDFKDGKKATYNENGLKFNINPTAPFVMTPTEIRYGDVLINRRMPLSQVLEGLKKSRIVKKAELRTITASNTEVYTSTGYVVESKKQHKFELQRRESKSSFDKENRQSVLNRKTQQFDRDLASFLNTNSPVPAQPKVQAKPVAKPKAPVKVAPVKTPAKPVAKSKASAKAVPVKAQAKAPVTKRAVTKKIVPVKKSVAPKVAPSKVRPAAPSKRVAAPINKNAKQTAGRRATTSSKRGIETKRFAARRAVVAKRPAVQRNVRGKHIGLRRKR